MGGGLHFELQLRTVLLISPLSFPADVLPIVLMLTPDGLIVARRVVHGMSLDFADR